MLWIRLGQLAACILLGWSLRETVDGLVYELYRHQLRSLKRRRVDAALRRDS